MTDTPLPTDDAVRQIAELGRKAAEVQILDVEGHPDHILIVQGDTHKLHEKPAKRRAHKVSSLTDLIGAVVRWDAKTVWHSGCDVVALCDDDRRDNAIRLRLDRSEQWMLLTGMAAKEDDRISQGRLIRLLVHDLASATGLCESLLSIIREIDFKRSASGGSNIQHGQESLGRSVEQEVQSRKGPIPEQFTLQVPVFSSPGLRNMREIRMSLHVDSENGTFCIKPLPDELNRAMDAAHAEIHENLTDEIPDASIFMGSPE